MRTQRMCDGKRHSNIHSLCLQDPKDSSKARLFLSPITGTGFTPTSFGAWFTRIIKKECGADISPGRLRCVLWDAFWLCLAHARVSRVSSKSVLFPRHMFVDARMSVDGGSGLNNNGIAQIMGNRPETWAKYYDLTKYVREGQDALLGMGAWRESMEALLVSTDEIASEELGETASAEGEDAADSDDAGNEDVICVSSDEEDDVNILESIL